MIHKVRLSNRCKSELQSKDKKVIDCLFNNFVRPIKNGYVPPAELQGKYKPSHLANFMDSPMAASFRQCAEVNNLHHYHIGYMHYRTGNDPDYPGDVSEGIAHTRIESCAVSKKTEHIIIQVSEKHSPFVVPINRARDE